MVQEARKRHALLLAQGQHVCPVGLGVQAAHPAVWDGGREIGVTEIWVTSRGRLGVPTPVCHWACRILV